MRVLNHVKECADLRHFGMDDFLEKNAERVLGMRIISKREGFERPAVLSGLEGPQRSRRAVTR